MACGQCRASRSESPGTTIFKTYLGNDMTSNDHAALSGNDHPLNINVGNATVIYANELSGWALPGGGVTSDPIHAEFAALRMSQLMRGLRKWEKAVGT